jgi:hypothetical protein
MSKDPEALPEKPHSVNNDVGSVKTHFSVHLPRSVFSLTRNLFPATKVRARIVRWNRLSSTSHLFDPNPRQDQSVEPRKRAPKTCRKLPLAYRVCTIVQIAAAQESTMSIWERRADSEPSPECPCEVCSPSCGDVYRCDRFYGTH